MSRASYKPRSSGKNIAGFDQGFSDMASEPSSEKSKAVVPNVHTSPGAESWKTLDGTTARSATPHRATTSVPGKQNLADNHEQQPAFIQAPDTIQDWLKEQRVVYDGGSHNQNSSRIHPSRGQRNRLRKIKLYSFPEAPPNLYEKPSKGEIAAWMSAKERRDGIEVNKRLRKEKKEAMKKQKRTKQKSKAGHGGNAR